MPLYCSYLARLNMRVTLKFVKFVGGFGFDVSDGWAQQLFVK